MNLIQLPKMPAQQMRMAQSHRDTKLLFKSPSMRNSSEMSLKSISSVELVKKCKYNELIENKMEEEFLALTEKPVKRVTFKQRGPLPQQTMVKDSGMQTGLTLCRITKEPRAIGGANNPAERKVGWLARTDSECQFKAPGIDFLTDRETDVTTFEVKMTDSVQNIKDYRNKCDFFPKYVDNRRFKDQTTQTLYRESSAQTVAYLPEVKNRPEADDFEIFNLAKLLPGDKPPGLHEVEILERARKRWAFNKALKTNFMKELHEARENAIKSKYRPILEAFEWEQWIEREEYIQECQMMRLEIVIRMFDKRELQMHEASIARIEYACQTIEQRRQNGLHKNEIEYQRAVRRLQIKNAGLSRRWVKQSPMYSLGSPCSEFYGPLIRHGVDPARRNFVGDGRKAFDMRIDNLEKRVNMDNLECPFSKLKEWSKPKEYVKEYEQNFCSDKHLQKLYESLKTLRTQATKHKTSPKCLKRRPKLQENDTPRPSFNYKELDSRDFFRVRHQSQGSITAIQRTPSQMIAIEKHIQQEEKTRSRMETAADMLRERRQEDLEQLLNMYEGTTIGWIMQFLSEEMERLKEQRKLHFFSILTQKERWRREAAEAGLRQKENDMRLLYEDIFQHSNSVHNEVTEDYISNILTTDIAHIADCDAAATVTAMAKQIDREIERWLESFKLVQTPLTYEPLREMLRSMLWPDVNELLVKYETNQIVTYIVEDVLFGRIWDELENFDIATTIASDLIDRLIDNDLYFFSTESESDEPQKTSHCEAEAIIRKIIRQAVPGRRWKTETERLVHENTMGLLDDLFDRILDKINAEPPQIEPVELQRAFCRPKMTQNDNIREFNRRREEQLVEFGQTVEADEIKSIILRSQILSLLKKMKIDNVTRDLTTDEQYKGEELREDPLESDTLLKSQTFVKAKPNAADNDVFGIVSLIDIPNQDDFAALRRTESDMAMAKKLTSSNSDAGDPYIDNNNKEANDIKTELVGLVEEITEYEADDEYSLWTSRMEDGESSPRPITSARDSTRESFPGLPPASINDNDDSDDDNSDNVNAPLDKVEAPGSDAFIGINLNVKRKTGTVSNYNIAELAVYEAEGEAGDETGGEVGGEAEGEAGGEAGGEGGGEAEAGEPNLPAERNSVASIHD